MLTQLENTGGGGGGGGGKVRYNSIQWPKCTDDSINSISPNKL